MGTFDGIQIGSSGLQAQRRGVEVAGQNIANVNTPGYTRQRLSITADAGPVTPAIHSTWDGTGLGVRSVEIARLRDQFLDRRAMEEGTRHAELVELADTLSSIERIFAEPSDTALSATIADFVAAFDDVANRPDDISARAQLLERARTLATSINQIDRSLSNMVELSGAKVDAMVAEVNTMAKQVAMLQDTIQSATASGVNANELRDQRDALIEQITDRVGGTVRNEDDGTVSLFLGGAALIRGNQSYPIEATRTGATLDIVWPKDGRSVVLAGASKGMLATANEVLPRYRSDLAAFSTSLKDQINAVHATGYDLDGNPGLDVFVAGPNGLEVNAVLAGDPRKVAASATPGTLDGSVAAKIAGLEGLNAPYRQMIVRLGVESQSATRRVQLQDAVVKQVDLERESASGVNLDEELTDLVRFQRAYEANSRFISAVDDLLNTLVNGTGRVGR